MITSHAVHPSFFDQPVAPYTSRALEVASPNAPIEHLASVMHGRDISAIPIVNAHRRLVGVVSRCDLVMIGVLHGGRRWTSPAMALPRLSAGEIMTRDPRTVSPTATIREVASVMASHAIHHVYVLDNAQLVGVVSAADLAAAVRDSKNSIELSAIMSIPVASVDLQTPLGSATELIEKLRVSGLIVTENGRPVGTFTDIEALAARDLPRSTCIDTLYEQAVVCLPDHTPLHRAAAHVAKLDVRRVVVCREKEAVGIVTALDLARFVAWRT